MDALVTSFIRTYVPIVVGIVVSWLATKGLEFDNATQVQLVSVFTGALIALYYAVVRVLETKWAKFGWLLGKPKAPTYGE